MNKEHLGMLEDKKFVDLKNNKDNNQIYPMLSRHGQDIKTKYLI